MDISVLLAKGLSKVVFKISTRKNLLAFRNLERLSIKFVKARTHLSYIQTCSNNKLLPRFTNTYINVYIYYIYLYIINQ